MRKAADLSVSRGQIGWSRSISPGVWMTIVAMSSLGLSRAFACAMPLVAVAVVAAMTLSRKQAAILVVIAWSGQQGVGFGFLHYPHTASTMGWGAAIGLAAAAALQAAWAVRRWIASGPASAVLALAIAFAGYEGVLFAATLLLPSGNGAFAPAVVLRILTINAGALGLFLAVHRLAEARSAAVARRLAPRHVSENGSDPIFSSALGQYGLPLEQGPVRPV